MSDRCPVCGYFDPENPPVDSAICASCGTQFGYHDAARTHEELRRQWIDRGCPWSHPRIPQPPFWFPELQLEEAGLTEPDKAPA